MALSFEQKEANKTNRRERDRAWRERIRQRRVAEEHAKTTLSDELSPEIERLGKIEREIESKVKFARNALDQKISAIRMEGEVVIDDLREKLKVARAALSEVYDRKRKGEHEIDRQVDAEFLDLKGDAQWSPVGWKRGQ